MLTDPDERAFPVPETENNCVAWGLTKREEFAKSAMKGLLGNCSVSNVPKDIATAAVKHADALIIALNANKSE